jgi:hypothetical protein
MQSLQHYARITIYKNDVDYSRLPSSVYLSLGLPNIEIVKRIRHYQSANTGFVLSAEIGCMHSLIFFKSIGATNIYRAIDTAALNGHIEVVKICKEWGAKSFDMAMFRAAEGGHSDIVRLCESWGVTDFAYAWDTASYRGHYDIVKMLIGWDVRFIDRGMERAAEGGHTHIVRLCRENGATSYKRSILAAARYGHIDIIKLYKEWGLAKYFEAAMVRAATYDNIEIVKLCKEYGAVEFGRAWWVAPRIKLRNLLQEWKDTHYDWIMIDAAERGDMELLKESKAKGAVEYNKALKYAACRGHMEIVTLLHSWGANDFNSAIRKVIRSHRVCCFELLKMFKEWNVDIDFDKALAVTFNSKIRSFLIEWSSRN